MPTRDTQRGYSSPGDDDRTTARIEVPQRAERPEKPERAEKAEKSERKPPLEVQVTRVRSAPGRSLVEQVERQAHIVEIWTRNTLYLCDANFVCVEVRDRATNAPELKHVALGARLLGGHKRYARTLHLVRPLPMPGTQAVFLRPGGRRDAQAYTSTVERVVFNYQVAALELSTDPQEAWADVTNHHLR
jgi:hypothetical protein